MAAKLLEHLKDRPIAPIALESKENQDIQALKLMCVIDFQVAKKNFYTEIEKHPKLLNKLLGFHSFKSYQYFEYSMPRSSVGGKILQCRKCELIGPYSLILTHSIISHNLHLSSKTCAWCNEEDMRTHVLTNTIDQCYEQYKQKFGISETDEAFPSVIDEVYRLLSQLSIKLGVNTKRVSSYIASTSKSKQYLTSYDDDIDREFISYQTRKRSKAINQKELDLFHQHAMTELHGPSASDYFFEIAPKRPRRIAQKSTAKMVANPIKYSIPVEAEQQQITQQQVGGNEFKFGNFIASVLDNMQCPILKKKAKTAIQQTAVKFMNEDTVNQ